jgi:HlyD family secretion protein
MNRIFTPNNIVIALLIAFGGIALPLNAADDNKPSTAAKPALTVTTVRPQAADLKIKLSANGNVASWQETIVGAEVNGLRLIDVKVNVGDTVKRGQLLATFAPETVNAELAQQGASVAEAEASLAEANANAARARTLEESGALSAQQINQYMTAAKTAEARLAAAKAAANSVQIRLKNTRVLAPDNGMISARTATVGSVVQAGQELFRLIRGNRLEWRAEVTAAELNKVKIGQAATVTTPGGDAVAGKVRMIAPTIDAQTRNAIVYVDLPANSAARAGMFAKGEFALGQSNALTVPQQAVVVRDGFSYVFAANAKNGANTVVKQIKVKAGRRTAEQVEILDGLKAEDTIVAAGAGFLNDGDTVSVSNDAKPKAAAAAPAPAAIPAKAVSK